MPARLKSTLLAELPLAVRARIRKGSQPDWLPPMLATLTAERFSRPGWLFEPKLDGERCLVYRRGSGLRLFSRNQKLLNGKYPELAAAFEAQKRAFYIVDGEIVAFEKGVTSFTKLQQRMQAQRPSDELRHRIPVFFYA